MILWCRRCTLAIDTEVHGMSVQYVDRPKRPVHVVYTHMSLQHCLEHWSVALLRDGAAPRCAARQFDCIPCGTRRARRNSPRPCRRGEFATIFKAHYPEG